MGIELVGPSSIGRRRPLEEKLANNNTNTNTVRSLAMDRISSKSCNLHTLSRPNNEPDQTNALTTTMMTTVDSASSGANDLCLPSSVLFSYLLSVLPSVYLLLPS